MKSIRKSVYRLLAISMVSGAAIALPDNVFAQDTKSTAEKTAEAVKIFDYRDPRTDQLIRFEYQPSTKADLDRISPSRYRSQINSLGPAPTLGSAAKKLFVDFPAEYLAFTLAMGISQSLHLENNPTFAKNFINENASVVGGVSFAGFLVGARGSHSFLQMLGLAHDPHRSPISLQLRGVPYYSEGPSRLFFDEKKGQFWNVEAPQRPNYLLGKVTEVPAGPTRVQRAFAPLVGPMGLAAGMMVSNVIHEVFADKELQTCVKATMFGATVVQNAEAQKLIDASIDEACDKAWDSWKRKAGDWTPDILSMGATSFIQAYAVNPLIAYGYGKAKQGSAALVGKAGIQVGTDLTTGAVRATAVRVGSEKFVPYVLKGARFFRGLTGMHPVGRFVMTTGNITLFMEIVHPLSLIKKPFEQSRQGRDITERINSAFYELERAEKNKWVWAPQPSSDFCTGYEMDAMGSSMPNMGCYETEQHDPAFLLRKMAERQAKWREFVLQDAFLAHQNWQSYVANYATMYGNATAFYSQMVQLINYQRYHPRAKTRPAHLYVADPFYGLYSDPENRDEASAVKAVTEAREWLETYYEGARLKSNSGNFRLHSTERDVLPEILLGLRAMDEKVPLATLSPIEVGMRRLDQMTETQQKDFDHRIRRRLLESAIKKLRGVLANDLVYSDKGIPLTSPEYKRRAATNPFMALRLRLGDPEPMAPGLAFIRESNDDASVIEQTSKNDHPGGIGRVRTDRMSDFLLASMVCGPEADPRFSDSDKIKIFRKRKMGYAESLYSRLGLGQRTLSASDADVMNAVQEEIEADTENSRNILPNPSTGATSHESIGFSADFRPPRIVEGIPASICQNFAENSDRNKSMYDGSTAVWTINGEKYEGMLDIVRKKIRTDLVGTAVAPQDKDWVSPFTKWWETKVNTHTEKMIAKFRTSYRSLLKEKYLPALNGVRANGFWNRVYSAIGLLDEGSVKYNGRDFKLGALESLYDEAGLYVSIVGKVTKIPKTHPQRKLFDDLSAGVLLEYRNMGSLVTDLELVEAKGEIAKTQFDLKRKALETKINELKKLVDELETTKTAGADALKVNDQAFKNLNGLMGEMDSYWGIIRSIQVSPSM